MSLNFEEVYGKDIKDFISKVLVVADSAKMNGGNQENFENKHTETKQDIPNLKIHKKQISVNDIEIAKTIMKTSSVLNGTQFKENLSDLDIINAINLSVVEDKSANKEESEFATTTIENFQDVFYEFSVTFKPKDYNLKKFNDFVIEKYNDGLLKFKKEEDNKNLMQLSSVSIDVKKFIEHLSK